MTMDLIDRNSTTYTHIDISGQTDMADINASTMETESFNDRGKIYE